MTSRLCEDEEKHTVREETPPPSETSSLSPLSMAGLCDRHSPPQLPQMYPVRPPTPPPTTEHTERFHLTEVWIETHLIRPSTVLH